MTLQQLITSITGNKNVVITVNDSNEDMLIKFFVGGQAVLSSELMARTVASMRIENATSVVIDLNPAA